MLAVDGDQVQVELSGALVLGVFKDDLEVSGFVVSLEGDGVVVVSELHDLGEVGDGDSQNHVSVGTVVLEAVHGQVQGHQGNVG